MLSAEVLCGLSVEAPAWMLLPSITEQCRQAACAQIYKDSNHKPEMAIAITDFEALCGFVPHAELTDALQTVPELRELIGDV